MRFIIDGEKLPEKGFIETMQKAAELCLARENVTNDDIEISITFVDDEEIRSINSQFRDVDNVTDVLSFPQFEFADEIPDAGMVALGDVVICEEQAHRQAEEFGHSFERELIYLFVHSMFHLLGYDHIKEDEKAQMRQAEEDVMKQLDILRD